MPIKTANAVLVQLAKSILGEGDRPSDEDIALAAAASRDWADRVGQCAPHLRRAIEWQNSFCRDMGL